MSDIRIYVASLTDYNNGTLHGAWVDAEQAAEDILADIASMLNESPTAARVGMPAEEWAIHDHEGFEGYAVEEYEGIERVAALAAAIKEHGAPFVAYLNHTGADVVEGAVRDFRDAYLGSYRSAADYMEQLMEDCGDIPANLAPYIDWERMARDAEMGGDLWTAEADGEVHIFIN